MVNLAERLLDMYEPVDPEIDQPWHALVRDVKKMEEERNTFFTILSLQQTVKELETRLNPAAAEPDLTARVRSALNYLCDLADFTPAAGHDEGWVNGIMLAVEEIEKVL